MNDIIFILKNLPKRFKIFSISKKVALSNFILLSAILTIFYSYSKFFTYPIIEKNIKDKIEYTIKFLENDIKVALDFESERAMNDILTKALSFKEILAIEIRKSKKVLFSKYKDEFKLKQELTLKEEIILFENEDRTFFVYSYPIDSEQNINLILYYSADEFLNSRKHYEKFTFYVVFGFFILIVIFSFFIKIFLLPFTKLVIAIDNIDFNNLKTTKIEVIKTSDERGEITKSFNDMLERISKEIEKNREKDKMLIQQSKLASMGEMIGNIAHQWRQPLNALGIILQTMNVLKRRDKLSAERVETSVTQGMQIINSMSTTIDDFRNFFKPNKRKEEFFLKDSISEVLHLVSASLVTHQIELNIRNGKDIKVIGFKNELSQVILNIITNAKDAILENEIKNGKIEINLKRKNKMAIIELIDNAGGINEEIIDRIFEPYFSTKEQGKGTGIGLYMSKAIIDSMDGNLRVENIGFRVENEEFFGACFIVELPIKE